MNQQDRWNIVFCRQRGMTFRAIQREYGYSQSTISLWWRRFCETGGVDDAPRSGRPFKLTEEERKAVERSLKRKATGSLAKTAKYMKLEHGVTICDSTVANTAKRMGLVYRLRKTKPLLSEEDKLSRLRFANVRRPGGFWSRVMWSDEASFALFSTTRGEWVTAGNEASPHETVKWPPRIRVWAAISSKGKTKLHRIPKKMNAEGFEKLL